MTKQTFWKFTDNTVSPTNLMTFLKEKIENKYFIDSIIEYSSTEYIVIGLSMDSPKQEISVITNETCDRLVSMLTSLSNDYIIYKTYKINTTGYLVIGIKKES